MRVRLPLLIVGDSAVRDEEEEEREEDEDEDVEWEVNVEFVAE